jgi:hypothetical protein
MLIVMSNPNTGLPFVPGGSHYLSIRVSNENGWSAPSAERPFRVPRPVPLIPIVEVKDITSRTAALDIFETFRAESFRIAIVDAKNETVVQNVEVAGTSALVSVDGLEPATDYTVIAVALNQWGASFPAVVTFTTLAETAASISVAANGDVTVEVAGLPSDATGWIVVGVEYEGEDTVISFEEENIVKISEGSTTWDEVEEGTYLLAVAYYSGSLSNYTIVLQTVITVPAK